MVWFFLLTGRKGLVEKNSLIKHSTNQQKKQQEQQRLQTMEARNTSHRSAKYRATSKGECLIFVVFGPFPKLTKN